MAVDRVGASVGRRSRAAGARALGVARRTWSTRRPVVLGAAGVLLVIVAVVATLRSSTQAEPVGDLVSALARSRTSDKPIERAAAAVQMREFGEALEALERARAATPAIAADATFVALSLQTFNAGRAARSAALLAQTPKDEAISALQQASLDWSYRVRHGAADLLKTIGVGLEDPIGFGLLDVWQLERCDQRRATASKLLATHARDARLVAGLDAAARRPADEGCLRDLLSAPSAAR